MIEIVLDGWLWWFVTTWVVLLIGSHFASILYPNWNIKRMIKSGILPRDTVTVAFACFFMMLWIYVLLWLVGIV